MAKFYGFVIGVAFGVLPFDPLGAACLFVLAAGALFMRGESVL